MYRGDNGWDRRGRVHERGVRLRSRRRVRPQRLTLRGRLTLTALFAGIALPLGTLAAQWVSAPPASSDSRAAPAVSATGPATPKPEPPRFVFERPPPISLATGTPSDSVGAHLVAHLPLGAGVVEGLVGPLRVEYSLDSELTRRIARILRRNRVPKGHVVVMHPGTGRLLAYASTSPDHFPPTKAYPAASLIKVVTAAAALHHAPDRARSPCRFRGNPYRLSRSRLHPPSLGREASLERALATSNNQCFAQLAVNALGADALLSAIERFGWLRPPAPGHDAGSVEVGDDDYDLGRLGCGLRGCRITPLHAVQLVASLANGELVDPWWVEQVTDAAGTRLAVPPRPNPRRVMTSELAAELRQMLVRTTTRGTARKAFRDRRGRPRLGPVRVAGKTGNVSGVDPKGRFEWFAGLAPADDPTIAVAVLQVHGDLWWARSSSVAADVLAEVFCERKVCAPELADRYSGTLEIVAAHRP